MNSHFKRETEDGARLESSGVVILADARIQRKITLLDSGPCLTTCQGMIRRNDGEGWIQERGGG